MATDRKTWTGSDNAAEVLRDWVPDNEDRYEDIKTEVEDARDAEATLLAKQEEQDDAITDHIADTTTHGTAGDIVGTSDSQTLTNKTLTSPVIAEIVSGGNAMTVPSAVDTFVGKATTDAFTNKTFNAEGTGNSLSNVKDADIKAGAAIDASKLADGSVSNTELQYINSLASNVQDQLDVAVPAGIEAFCYTETPPTGYLEEDGSARSMTVYNSLHLYLGGTSGLNAGETFTTTFATNRIDDVAHGLSDNDVIRMTTSAGDLPNGFVVDTDYYVINETNDDYQVSLTQGGAAVTISDDGTGTHKWHDEFLLQDPRGRAIRCWDHGAGIDTDAATRTARPDGVDGDVPGSDQDSQNKEHTHTTYNNNTNNAYAPGGATIGSFNKASGSSGGDQARPINTNRMIIVKY